MVIETIGTEKGKKARRNQASCCDDTVKEKKKAYPTRTQPQVVTYHYRKWHGDINPGEPPHSGGNGKGYVETKLITKEKMRKKEAVSTQRSKIYTETGMCNGEVHVGRQGLVVHQIGSEEADPCW